MKLFLLHLAFTSNRYTMYRMHTPPGVLDPLGDPKDGHILTGAIIDTIREPLIVLDEKLRIIAASRSFYEKFNLTHENTYDKLFYELGTEQWNIPALRILLERVIPESATIEEYEVKHNFPSLGERTMLVNARAIRYENGGKKMLLSIFDITDQRTLESEREKLFKQKDLLLKEMRHRIANSLQLIASILLLKAGIVESEETRFHLNDAHERIMSIATVQRQLDPGGIGEEIDVNKYLTALCESLARSMVGGRKPITLEVSPGTGTVSSESAISLGLLTTELVINAIKHAFPDNRKGVVTVTYESQGEAWSLSVADNGVGHVENDTESRHGLGTSIVTALAHQLKAGITTESTEHGTKVSLTKKKTQKV